MSATVRAMCGNCLHEWDHPSPIGIGDCECPKCESGNTASEGGTIWSVFRKHSIGRLRWLAGAGLADSVNLEALRGVDS